MLLNYSELTMKGLTARHAPDARLEPMLRRTSDEEVSRLRKLAGLRSDTYLEWIRRRLEAALGDYGRAQTARPQDIKRQIRRLWAAAKKVKNGKTSAIAEMARAHCELSSGARAFLRTHAQLQDQDIGEVLCEEECRDLAHAQEIAEQIYFLLLRGESTAPFYRELGDLKNAAERVARGDEVRQAAIARTKDPQKRHETQKQLGVMATKERAVLIRGLGSLTRPAMRNLKKWATGLKVTIPDKDALGTVASAKRSAQCLFSILEFGMRKRTKRLPRLTVPEINRGHPIHYAERELIIALAGIYLRAKGKPVPRVHHHHLGPFGRFVKEVLILAGAPHVDAAELISWYRKEPLAEGMQDYIS